MALKPVEPAVSDKWNRNAEKAATTNACKLCAPLGACIAFRGVEGAMPLLHGSQGCATYIRRYIISHFREPLDVASSSFSETTAVYGGEENLRLGLKNVAKQYRPRLIGVATTCLAETIGDDVQGIVKDYRRKTSGDDEPLIITVSTPSYSGTHMDGFRAAVQAVIETLAEGGPRRRHLNILPGFVSPADIRYLQEILDDFELPHVLLPDYSQPLDAPALAVYEKIPSGGTPVQEIRKMGCSAATVEFGATLDDESTAGVLLNKRFGVPRYRLGLPIGIRETDRFFNLLEKLGGRPVPNRHRLERGRLIDSYIDAHKIVFGQRVVVYGEEDLVAGLAAFLAEIGALPVLCASGGESGRLAEAIFETAPDLAGKITVREGVDFMEIADEAKDLSPDLLIGNSKGYFLARLLAVPLVRVGFPVHDRFGGSRLLHLGYRGAQQLFDRIVNTIIEERQNSSSVGYGYM